MDSSRGASNGLFTTDFNALPLVQPDCVTVSEVELGRGAFGIVFEGTLRKREGDTVQIAVKIPKSDSTTDERNRLISEAKLVNKLNHPNIVKLLGVCLDNGMMLLLFELMQRGDLLSCLRASRPTQNTQSSLSLATLIQMAIDVVSGCEYLEGQEGIHCDIAARNCLVSESGIVKLADFGHSHDVQGKGYYRFGGGSGLPYRWMAPETTFDEPFTAKSDVWSFGVLLWEMITLGEEPYKGLSARSIFMFIQAGHRLEIPRCCPKDLHEIITICWRLEAAERPAFSALHQRLFKLLRHKTNVTHTPFPPYFVETTSCGNCTLLKASTQRDQPVTSCSSSSSSSPASEGDNSANIATSFRSGYSPILNLTGTEWHRNPQTNGVQLASATVNVMTTTGLSSPKNELECLRRELAEEYRSYTMISVFANLEPVPVDELFVHLKFRTPNGIEIRTYREAIGPFLDTRSSRKHLLIWGQPGQGKTVLVKKICHDWTQTVDGVVSDDNRYIADVDLLFTYSLRHLDKHVEKIADILAERYAKFIHLNASGHVDPSRILVLLDGYDELQSLMQCVELYAIMFKPYAATPFPLIVTSRPIAVCEARLTSTAEVCGIVGTELPKFVAKYCSNETNARRVLNYIRENSMLKERIFRCPLLLTMLCSLIESNAYVADYNKVLPRTQTELYLEICDCLVTRYNDKYNAANHNLQWKATNDKVFRALSRFAFETTICDDSRLVFGEDELQHIGVDIEKSVRIGFLTTDESSLSKVERNFWRRQIYSFLHRTFQEFFAAVFASENPSLFTKGINRIKFKKFISSQFLTFLAGLINKRTECAVSETLLRCLQEKSELVLFYDKSLSEQKQRRKMYQSRSESRQSAFCLEEPFYEFVADVLFEAESRQVRETVCIPFLSTLQPKAKRSPIWLLNYTMLRNGLAAEAYASFPPSWELSVGFLRMSNQCYRCVTLAKPISAFLTCQTSSHEGENGPLVNLVELRCAAVEAFFFTGEMNALCRLLHSGLVTLCVTSYCTLTFLLPKNKETIDENIEYDNVIRDRIEVSEGGRLSLRFLTVVESRFPTELSCEGFYHSIS